MGEEMKNFNILIIEDEALVALEMKQSIEEMGFHILDYVTNSLMAKEILEHQNVHLIIMDINLGESEDGIDFYQSLNCNIPVIYLTAYKDEKTINKAIETNPYGYIVKPYQNEELYAIIKLVYFKVYENKTTSATQFLSEALYHLDEAYAFDLKTKQLLYNKMNIHLTAREKQLLALLIDYDGEALSFETIEAVIWENEPTSNNTIRTLVYRLRGKINPNLIEKVFGYGIRFGRSSTRI